MARRSNPCEHGKRSRWKCSDCLRAYHRERYNRGRSDCCLCGTQLPAPRASNRKCRSCNPDPLPRVPKTHCPQGHPRTPENLRMYGGTVRCVPCQVERNKAWKAAHPEATAKMNKRASDRYRAKLAARSRNADLRK